MSELKLVGIEHPVGNFKLDILCTDGDEQVFIENQLKESNHKRLGQILAYAAGVNAGKVNWIAESFRSEQPNNWARASREQAPAASSASPAKQHQLRFWTALVERLAKESTEISPARPGPYHWLNTRDERLGVELSLASKEAKRHFSNLLLQNEQIEAALRLPLDWQELPNKTASRLASW